MRPLSDYLKFHLSQRQRPVALPAHAACVTSASIYTHIGKDRRLMRGDNYQWQCQVQPEKKNLHRRPIFVVITLAPLQGRSSLQSSLPECRQSSRSVVSSINHQTLMTRNEWSIISGMYHSIGRSCNCDMRTHSGSWWKLVSPQKHNSLHDHPAMLENLSVFHLDSPVQPHLSVPSTDLRLNTVLTTQAKSNIQLLHSLNNDSYASLCVS